MSCTDYIVIGGGMLGAAIGYGLARQGLACTILDGHDRDFRAARGNFGLVWVQSKGGGFPAYAQWTRNSSKLWPEFSRELKELTGIDVQFKQTGGVHFCLTDEELVKRQAHLEKLVTESDGDFSYRMLDHSELLKLEPELGPTIAGGSWSAYDGHVNPLYLLRAMHAGFSLKGGDYLTNHKVKDIEICRDGYRLHTEKGELHCRHVILASGLDNARLAPMVGLKQPVFVQRGQILVSERIPKILNHPSNYLRQTVDGTVLIGDTKESVGLDDGQTVQAMAKMARQACKILPRLGQRRIVRGWGALRVLSADGSPIYEQGNNAWAFSSHSGVTLAAIHALKLSSMIKKQIVNTNFLAFSANRF
tara:strand:- start:5219 stop:6304 length:1086 start_codon:yes stop_codon:yes gene_type:complete